MVSKVLAALLVQAAAQERGQEGQCIHGRFHEVNYDMSDDVDPETGMPRNFSIHMVPRPDEDDKCLPPNAGGSARGVCVGANTRDCQNAASSLNINGFLSCERCFVGVTTDIDYDLEVQDSKLQKVSVAFRNTKLKGALELLAHQSSSQTVASGTFPIINSALEYNIDFVVAGVVPVNINFKLPTDLTYSVTLSQETNVRFGTDVNLDLGEHAIEWTEGGGFSTPSSGSQGVTWSPVFSADGKVQADLPITLRSTLQVELQRILSYGVGFQPSLLQAVASASTAANNEVCLSGSANFLVDHKASVHFELFGQRTTFAEWGPGQLYQRSWDKVFEKCWDVPGEEAIALV